MCVYVFSFTYLWIFSEKKKKKKKKNQKSIHKDNIEKALKAAFLLKLKEKFRFCMFDFFCFLVLQEISKSFFSLVCFRGSDFESKSIKNPLFSLRPISSQSQKYLLQVSLSLYFSFNFLRYYNIEFVCTIDLCKLFGLRKF